MTIKNTRTKHSAVFKAKVALAAVPPVPTSRETAPSEYLCTDGRRMDLISCPNQFMNLTKAAHRRIRESSGVSA